ncbi:GIP [Symbiodinium sp. CCMP2592]|nr:GIP [Symbiodinium sp. CCMP2592]
MLRIVPSLFIRNFGDGWSLLSLDVSDAFLQCKQQHDTLTKVDGKWYKLFRMLPGQRDGSATWFQDFMCEIRAAVAAEPLAEQPVLFRIPHAEGNHKCQGGGMVHVDDMLAAGLTARLQELENHLKSKFKVSSEWIRQVGDEVSFLKRRLILVSPNLLVVEPDIKYLEKLLKITGLDGAKERYKAAPFPTGGLPTDLSSDRELNSESASKYRSALGLICNRVSEQKTSTLEMFSDSDWSGDKKTRKSAEYNSLVAGAATAILLKNCVIHLSLGNRQGVGRTRHIDGKLLWLQQMTQEKMLDISPVGTAENVGDLPTKPLKPERVEFILARLNVRDKDCGYALVGNAHLLDHRTRHHVSRIVKRGAVNPQLVLQILALALQADSVASADDEPNTHRDDALSQGTGEHGYGDGAWKSATTAAYPSDFAAFFARLSLSAVSELRAVADSDLIPINIPSSAEAFATECIARGAFDRASVQILFDLLPKTRPHKVTGSAEPGTAFFGGTMHQEGVTAPRSTCYTFPEAMRVINAFLRSVDPCHHYAAFVLTKNVSSEVHRDPRNAAVPNMIDCGDFFIFEWWYLDSGSFRYHSALLSWLARHGHCALFTGRTLLFWLHWAFLSWIPLLRGGRLKRNPSMPQANPPWPRAAVAGMDKSGAGGAQEVPVGVDHAAREAFDPKTSRAFGQPMQEFVDGFGLCSPGRWAPEAREKLASSDEVAHAEKIRGLLRLLRDFVIDQLKDPKDMAFRLATGHVKKSPFAQSALQKLRQRIVDIIPGVNKQLTLQWRPRDENTLSDAITNHDFSSFCPELRVPLKLDDLPLDIFRRMIHSREAFVNARVSLQHLVSRETSMSRREKEQSKTPW